METPLCPSQYKRPFAVITGDGVLYEMVKTRAFIGRKSHLPVDIDIGESPCVSRKHLELIFVSGKLYLNCLGKNGVFVNEEFVAYSLEQMELPKCCVIRFPSTSITLCVDTVDNRSSPSTLSSSSVSSKVYNPKKRALLAASVSDDIPSLGVAHHCRDEGSLSESSSDVPDHPRRDSLPPPILAPEVGRNTPSDTHQPMSDLDQEADNEDAAMEGPSDDLASTGPEDQDDVELEAVDYGSSNRKPPYSYAQMIIQAIARSPERRLSLSAIYAYISKHFLYYKPNDKGWQNSIRHNLSLNRYFTRIPRNHEEPGKGSFWRLDPACEKRLTRQAFRKRRQRGLSLAGAAGIPRKARSEEKMLGRPKCGLLNAHRRGTNQSLSSIGSDRPSPSSIGGSEVGRVNSVRDLSPTPQLYRPKALFPQDLYQQQLVHFSTTQGQAMVESGAASFPAIREDRKLDYAPLTSSTNAPFLLASDLTGGIPTWNSGNGESAVAEAAARYHLAQLRGMGYDDMALSLAKRPRLVMDHPLAILPALNSQRLDAFEIQSKGWSSLTGYSSADVNMHHLGFHQRRPSPI